MPVRPDPYWQRLSEGAYLGFRRGPNTWLARYRGRDKVQKFKPLGEALEFDEAKRLAEEWFGKMSGAPVRSVKRATVKSALEAYLADLTKHGRAAAAKEALGRYKLTVYEDDIAAIALESATRDDFQEWRGRLMKGRQPRSVNRQVRAVIAGLNCAQEELGYVGNPAAWSLKPLADDI